MPARFLPAALAACALLAGSMAAADWEAGRRAHATAVETRAFAAEVARSEAVLGSSALLAAVTGEPLHAAGWQARAALQEARIAHLLTLAPQSRADALLTHAGTARRIEGEALENLRLGNADAARSLMRGPGYAAARARIEALAAQVEAAAAASARAHARTGPRAWGLVALTGLLAIGTALALMIQRRRREERARRDAQRDTMRRVMATVMDAQNNFLNNLVWFRYRAERGMDGKDLAQLDEAIRDAKHRMIEISEIEEPEARDLGGVQVLKRAAREGAAREGAAREGAA